VLYHEIQKIHELYLSGMKMQEIALQMGITRSNVSTIISRQRAIEPEKWPFRHTKEKDKLKDLPLRDARLNRVCVLEDCDFYWDEPELMGIVKMWEMGISVEEMAESFDRDPDEVILAVIHLARNNKIKQRKGGIFGWI
jgi:hypothetical protein